MELKLTLAVLLFCVLSVIGVDGTKCEQGVCQNTLQECPELDCPSGIRLHYGGGPCGCCPSCKD